MGTNTGTGPEQLVLLLERRPGLRISEVATRLSVSPATAHRYAADAVEQGLIHRRNARYYVGPVPADLLHPYELWLRGYVLTLPRGHYRRRKDFSEVYFALTRRRPRRQEQAEILRRLCDDGLLREHAMSMPDANGRQHGRKVAVFEIRPVASPTRSLADILA